MQTLKYTGRRRRRRMWIDILVATDICIAKGGNVGHVFSMPMSLFVGASQSNSKSWFFLLFLLLSHILFITNMPQQLKSQTQ